MTSINMVLSNRTSVIFFMTYKINEIITIPNKIEKMILEESFRITIIKYPCLGLEIKPLRY